jgi:hypothetical protein
VTPRAIATRSNFSFGSPRSTAALPYRTGGLPKTTATKLIAALALKAFLFGGSMATVAGGPMPDLVGKKR